MDKIKFNKKTISKIIVITIIILLIGTSVSANIPIDLKNNKKTIDIYSFMGNIDNKDNLENIEQSNLFNNFKKLIGNDSEIHFCGPAYIKSLGKGLHLGRLIKLIRLRIPIDIPQPDWIGFERRIMNLWFVYCSYFNDENAITTITPLNKDENITLTGNHTVFTTIIVFPQPFNFREKINEKLKKFFHITINFPIKKVQGNMFWYWHNSSNYLLNFIISYPMLMAWFLIWPFKIKTQFIGFIKPIEWYSYTPFVIWTNSSIIK